METFYCWIRTANGSMVIDQCTASSFGAAKSLFESRYGAQNLVCPPTTTHPHNL